MTALALQYQEEGEHAFAIAAAEQARQVVRINYGLHSMLEAPLLQQLSTNPDTDNAVRERARWGLSQILG